METSEIDKTIETAEFRELAYLNEQLIRIEMSNVEKNEK